MIRFLRCLVTLSAASAIGWAADGPRVVYTKSFPGSVPAYVSISVERSGVVGYKESPDDDPDQFQLEESEAASIFDLAQKLDHFSHPLESGLKIANMGMKTFRWEEGDVNHEAKFNYSLDENAKALHDIFEKITDTERMLAELKRSVRHDKLGVNEAIVNIQTAYVQKRLMGAHQFLPMLDQVAKNDTYIHMARERAAQLVDAIQASKPKGQ
jgi:hypothetical protein